MGVSSTSDCSTSRFDIVIEELGNAGPSGDKENNCRGSVVTASIPHSSA